MPIRLLIGFLASVALAAPSPLLPAKDLSSEEKAWLNLVEPIITSEERRIFRKKLSSHQKRAAFVSLFWAKRDPDLNDDTNPFRRNYLARYDYAMANFDRGNRRPQSAKGQIFLLLGKPTRVEMRVDFRLTGLDYSNRFIQFQPELWIYESVGYEFPRRELRIQFVPVSSFGEFSALTDQLSWHFIRNLKYKFILHRDLKKAPLGSSGGENFQADLEKGLARSGVTGAFEDDDSGDSISRPTTGITQKPVATIPKPEPKTKPIKPKPRVANTPPPQPKPESPPPTVAKPSVKIETPPQPVEKPAPTSIATNEPVSAPDTPKPKIKPAIVEPTPPPTKRVQTDSPAPTSTTPAQVPNTSAPPDQPKGLGFSPNVGNSLNVAVELAHFSRDPNQSLLLARLGIPMANLNFQFNGEQYETAFVLIYQLSDHHGRVYGQDRIENRMVAPHKEATESKAIHYAREITMLVPPGRYTLQAQVEVSSGNRVSYETATQDVLAFTANTTEVTPLVILDPNISDQNSQIQVGGKPFGLHLSRTVSKGDRLYPLIEITGPISENTINSIEFVVLEREEPVTRWALYPEETTQTPQQTLWVHPVFNTKALESGNYILRFEMEQSDGQLMTRDAPFSIQFNYD